MLSLRRVALGYLLAAAPTEIETSHGQSALCHEYAAAR